MVVRRSTVAGTQEGRRSPKRSQPRSSCRSPTSVFAPFPERFENAACERHSRDENGLPDHSREAACFLCRRSTLGHSYATVGHSGA
jgi:hypothetical protein